MNISEVSKFFFIVSLVLFFTHTHMKEKKTFNCRGHWRVQMCTLYYEKKNMPNGINGLFLTLHLNSCHFL